LLLIPNTALIAIPQGTFGPSSHELPPFFQDEDKAFRSPLALTIVRVTKKIVRAPMGTPLLITFDCQRALPENFFALADQDFIFQAKSSVFLL
jgi:hypothetical protein